MNECTDCSNKEQFTINIRWVDEHLNEHEKFIGLYQVSTIDAESLVSAIRDVLLRMNVKVADCRGQCYDGASNRVSNQFSFLINFQALAAYDCTTSVVSTENLSWLQIAWYKTTDLLQKKEEWALRHRDRAWFTNTVK